MNKQIIKEELSDLYKKPTYYQGWGNIVPLPKVLINVSMLIDKLSGIGVMPEFIAEPNSCVAIGQGEILNRPKVKETLEGLKKSDLIKRTNKK